MSLKLVLDQNKKNNWKCHDLVTLTLSKFLGAKQLLLICSASGIDSITSLSSVYSRGSTKKTMNLSHVCLWRNYLIFACCAYPRSPPLRSDSSEQDGGWVVRRYFITTWWSFCRYDELSLASESTYLGRINILLGVSVRWPSILSSSFPNLYKRWESIFAIFYTCN